MLLCTISIEENLVYQGGLRVLYTNFSMFLFLFLFFLLFWPHTTMKTVF